MPDGAKDGKGESVAHPPVMVDESVGFLQPTKTRGVYVDATLGLGGHSIELLKRMGPEASLIGIDRDKHALEIAVSRISDPRLKTVNSRFSEIETALEGVKADGVLLDLGVSMYQLKQPGRGFSFMRDEPLDMRMGTSSRLTAREILNEYSEAEIADIIFEYGEERQSRKIAAKIVRSRPIETTAELADIVAGVYGGRGRTHPATRTFQALRIAVNDEMNELRKALSGAVSVLAPEGRLVVISYHSMEDRIVKNFMRDSEKAGTLSRLTKKPLAPSLDEVRRNPSARSAKLRAGQKI